MERSKPSVAELPSFIANAVWVGPLTRATVQASKASASRLQGSVARMVPAPLRPKPSDAAPPTPPVGDGEEVPPGAVASHSVALSQLLEVQQQGAAVHVTFRRQHPSTKFMGVVRDRMQDTAGKGCAGWPGRGGANWVLRGGNDPARWPAACGTWPHELLIATCHLPHSRTAEKLLMPWGSSKGSSRDAEQVRPCMLAAPCCVARWAACTVADCGRAPCPMQDQLQRSCSLVLADEAAAEELAAELQKAQQRLSAAVQVSRLVVVWWSGCPYWSGLLDCMLYFRAFLSTWHVDCTRRAALLPCSG